MNGEDLADKAGIKKENRFIFSDSYYENMPEVPEKPNFDVVGLPKKETSSSNTPIQQASSFDQIIHNDYTKNDEEPSNHMFNFFSGTDSNESNNLSIKENTMHPSDLTDSFSNPKEPEKMDSFHSFTGKTSELNRTYGSNYFQENRELQTQDTYASSNASFENDSFSLLSTDLGALQHEDAFSNHKEDLSANGFSFDTKSSLDSVSSENNASTSFNLMDQKSNPLDVIHQAEDVSRKQESQKQEDFGSLSKPFENNLFGLPSTDSSALKPDDSNFSLNSNAPLPSNDVSLEDKKEQPVDPFSFNVGTSDHSNEANPSIPVPMDFNSSFSQEKSEITSKVDSQTDSTTSIFSNGKTNDSLEFYKPDESLNHDYFFGTDSKSLADIEKEKIEIPSVDSTHTKQENEEEEDSIDFIERLKNQEEFLKNAASFENSSDSSSSQFAIPVDQMEDKKDFLWRPIEKPKTEEIKIPERKLEYDQSFMSSTPSEGNKFIVNGDPSVEIKDVPKREISKIPDFMSGTFQASDLNISTGVNQELEAELLKQREEEEERKRKEALESSVYRNLNQNKKNQQLVYKAGGKSYVREVGNKPKIELWPANQPPTSSSESTSPQVEIPSVVTDTESTDLKSEIEAPVEEIKEESKKEQPKSIQELIESIVDVPGLSNIEVKLNPFENPGVKFGFQEKVDKEVIPDDQPTNVYDEKADNFDYDQNFENVEVVKSTLLEELIGKSHKEGKISILARYGEDFCARDYITNPAIGRAEEIKQLILILLTPEKSGILIGKPGIGKTSIVEGLAYQLQRNNVPEALKGFRIVSVKTPSLLGSLPTGETRLQTLVDELKELDKVILFIDEIHMLIGATNDSSMDFANMFKESLGRGTIKVIGATTTEEYERYILRDKAFVRRFQKVEVEEPSREHTIKILMGTLPKIEKTTGAKLKYSEFMKTEIMSFIVDITTEYKRIYGIGSRYPDICLTLLSQAFSQAVFANRTEVTINDIRKAIENSKNIYPDVIRKELVNFDQKFKDLIREEELGQ